VIGQRLRQKKCKVCPTKFKPMRNFQEACSVECAIKLGRIKEQKKADKAHREAKKNIKPMSHWLKITQDTFNEYIRLRDRNENCISCDAFDAPVWCAGHFRSRGSASHLRFNEQNVHKQCNKRCNLELSGNLAGYRPRLIAKIGLEQVEALENDNSTKTWTREELAEIRKIYRAKIRELCKKNAI